MTHHGTGWDREHSAGLWRCLQQVELKPLSPPQAMCRLVEQLRERLRRFCSESLPLFFLVMWVVVIGVVGSAVIVKILDMFFPTCEHKWVGFRSSTAVYELTCDNSGSNTLSILFKAHLQHKRWCSAARGGEAQPAAERRDGGRDRGRGRKRGGDALRKNDLHNSCF